MDRPVGGADRDLTLGDSIPDEDTEDGALEARIALAPAVRRLSDRDRRVIYMRFFEDHTQAEIGDELGVTQMQISRLLERILRDLRVQLA
ncbi:MAG TPA: sigma-70 family RNA polymerase sigma factor [Nocardioides sp.]|uniref:sigma-70 family RNA polymerase sigma factor n=1 Tax=uncultured Nocardioides sp. TaxID=198441 RepID=UPI0026136730|nr:sigma-70 family RNA polymerase sigma factor [uncultured Nocardioides sp.]HRI94488.1 sigma-70 family RNA polymerase sigma factor [Nocardioides sp.]HRK44426.1 sigma-70 family RNA polymerase sigma factor [Nocardioides sp.]